MTPTTLRHTVFSMEFRPNNSRAQYIFKSIVKEDAGSNYTVRELLRTFLRVSLC